MGAWIEIMFTIVEAYRKSVAPLVGAWIEIAGMITGSVMLLVAPLVGAWIEIWWYHQDF